MYTHKTLKRHRRTLRPQIKYPPNHKQGFVKTVIQNPPVPPDTQKHFIREEADEDGKRGNRESANGHNVTRLGPPRSC